jgi:hypothetical protein
VVEGARLESVYTSKGYRGFESLSLRKQMRLMAFNISLRAFLWLNLNRNTKGGTFNRCFVKIERLSLIFLLLLLGI